MKISTFYSVLASLLLCTACWAEQDFYGIQMKNEIWAQSLVLGTGPAPDPRDLAQGPIVNHQIHAEASLKPAGDSHLDFRVNVINDSDVEISTDFRYRDFFIYTKDGRKYSLIDENDDMRLDSIAPRSSRIFSPSLGNLRVQNEDVRMVSCSFDLGRTEIFLFPWSKKEEIGRLNNPAPAMEPAALAAPAFRKTVKIKPAQSWVPAKQASRTAPAGVAEETESPAPAPTSSRANLEQAIKNFVYRPASGVASVVTGGGSPRPAAASGPPGPVRSEAHVINYDKAHNFITLNLGAKDGLKENTVLSVLRDGKTVAKAKVKQLRDSVAAAILLPGLQSDIRPGDKISLV